MAEDVLILDDAAPARLAGRVLARASGERRVLVGLAGIPGSGKSTLAARIGQALHEAQPGCAVVVPLDGFHLRNQRLDELDLRALKGTPATFDAEGYLTLLRRARDPAERLWFPVYDRAIHDPVLRCVPEQEIGPSVRVVLTEGNFLLLDEPPWQALAEILDDCWFLETPPDTAREWILARHRRGGRGAADARAHYERVDLPNTRRILAHLRPPDLRLLWPPQR